MWALGLTYLALLLAPRSLAWSPCSQLGGLHQKRKGVASRRIYSRPTCTYLSARESSSSSEKLEDDNIAKKAFWDSQAALAASIKDMTDEEANKLKKINSEKFAARRLALVSDTAFFSTIIFCALWSFSSSPFTALSYLLGTTLGTAYSYGLGKYVETIGGSVDDEGAIEGAGVGQARFAFLILLFVVVGKFRANGLQEIPSIFGFFTYQLASLNQGLKEIDD